MLKQGIAFGINEQCTISCFGPVSEIAVPLALILNKIKRIIRLGFAGVDEHKQQQKEWDYGFC
jgi:hypothetical protein